MGTIQILNNDLKLAYDFCRDKTRREAKNFYYAFLLLPKHKREAIYVCYAFARECDDIVDEPSENKPEQLQELRKNLALAYQPSEKLTSPLFLALQSVVKDFSIPEKYFEELIDGMEMDLHPVQYQSFEELYQYCYKVASVVGLICIHIFRFDSEECIPYAVNLGIAMQLTNILRDIKEDAERGRIYLPVEELHQFQLSEAFILEKQDPQNEAFLKFMQFQVERAKDYFVRSQPLLPYLEKDAQICPRILQKLYQEILVKMEKQAYNIFQERIRLSKGRKIYLMLSAWWTKPQKNSYSSNTPKKD